MTVARKIIMNWNGTLSLLIACLELLLIINLLVFAQMNRMNRIAIVMVVLLAAYQTMEFLMCHVGLQSSFFPFFSFLIISFLPPLNLLLALTLTRNLTLSVYSLFIPAILFSIYYTFVIPEFAVTSCTVLYATYHYPLGDLFGFFYYLPILVSIVLLIQFIRKVSNGKQKKIGKVLLFGSIFISLPVVVGFGLMLVGNYSLISAIESIMCKFAIVYALCLSFVCVYNSPSRKIRIVSA